MIATSLRLLVVDDCRDAADSLSMVLQLHHHEVRVTYDGESALQAALVAAPDVMLIDIAMPRMDGLRLARLVQEQTSLRDTVLIAVTGHAGSAVEQRAKAAGFAHFLAKPYAMEELLALLHPAAVVT